MLLLQDAEQLQKARRPKFHLLHQEWVKLLLLVHRALKAAADVFRPDFRRAVAA